MRNEGWCPTATKRNPPAKTPSAIASVKKAGIADADLQNSGIQLYPNPSSGNVSISIPANQAGNWQVRVSSMEGRNVAITDYKQAGSALHFHVQTTAGLYLVRIVNAGTGREVVRKMVGR